MARYWRSSNLSSAWVTAQNSLDSCTFHVATGRNETHSQCIPKPVGLLPLHRCCLQICNIPQRNNEPHNFVLSLNPSCNILLATVALAPAHRDFSSYSAVLDLVAPLDEELTLASQIHPFCCFCHCQLHHIFTVSPSLTSTVPLLRLSISLSFSCLTTVILFTMVSLLHAWTAWTACCPSNWSGI